MAEPYLWKHPEFGTYCVIWMQGGKQRRKSLKTRDRKIANAKLNHFKRELTAGKVSSIIRKGNRRFYSFADEFLKEHADARTRDKTADLYRVALEKAKLSWGDIPLGHISSRHIDAFISDMIRAGLAKPTINKNLRHLKGALRKAFDWDYIDRPVKFPPPLPVEEKSRFLSAEQLRAIFGNIPDQEFYDLCLFALCTGLRSGEVLSLTWEDIDNPEQFMRIDSRQKSKRENRIPINSGARAVLDRCRARGMDRVFREISTTRVSKLFKKAVRKAKLPDDIRFHDLRHTFGSMLAMAGRQGKDIQDLMRHASFASTLVYAKLSPDHLREASESVHVPLLPMPAKK
jgi:integrase